MNCWSLLISYCRWSCHTALFFIITCRFKGQTTNYRQKYLFNCLIVCLWHNSHNEASGLLFIYACISTGHTHFENNKVHISWEPKRPAMLFLSSEMTKKPTRKAWFKVCGELLCQVFNSEKNLPLSKSLSVCKCTRGFIYGLLLPVNGLAQKNKQNIQTCMQTFMHAYIHIHFEK